MSSHSTKPRNYHDLENQIIGNDYQQLRQVRDIITSMMDDIYEEQILDTDTFKPGEFTDVSDDYN